jgi:hypothetical protein
MASPSSDFLAEIEKLETLRDSPLMMNTDAFGKSTVCGFNRIFARKLSPICHRHHQTYTVQWDTTSAAADGERGPLRIEFSAAPPQDPEGHAIRYQNATEFCKDVRYSTSIDVHTLYRFPWWW